MQKTFSFSAFAFHKISKVLFDIDLLKRTKSKLYAFILLHYPNEALILIHCPIFGVSFVTDQGNLNFLHINGTNNIFCLRENILCPLFLGRDQRVFFTQGKHLLKNVHNCTQY